MPAWILYLLFAGAIGAAGYWFALHKARLPNFRHSLAQLDEARTLWEMQDDNAESAYEAESILFLVATRHGCILDDEGSFHERIAHVRRTIISQREGMMNALSLAELRRDHVRIAHIAGYINGTIEEAMMDPDIDATIGSPYLMDCREVLLDLADKYGVDCDLCTDADSAAYDVRLAIETLMTSRQTMAEAV